MTRRHVLSGVLPGWAIITRGQFVEMFFEAAPGIYELRGMPSTFILGTQFNGEACTYVIEGQGAAFKRSMLLPAGAGQYILAGQSAGLEPGFTMVAGGGAYTLEGQQARMRRSRRNTAAAGKYVLAGQAASLKSASVMVASAGAYVLAGQAATLTEAAAGPTAVEITALGSASDPSNASSSLFEGQPLGAVDDYRRSIVVIWFRAASSRTLSSITLGGEAMSLIGTAAISTSGGNTTLVAFYGLNTGFGTTLAAATTADVVATYSGGVDRSAIANYRCIKAGTGLHATDDAVSLDDPPSASIDCEAGGAILGAYGGQSSDSPTVAWTNLTEDFESLIELRVFSTAHDEFASAQSGLSITATPSSSQAASAFAVIAIGNS